MNPLVVYLVIFSLLLFIIGVAFYVRGFLLISRTLQRMEFGARKIADDLESSNRNLKIAARQREKVGHTLERMESAAHTVAENLADSVSRADATIGPEGAAADAALRTGDTAAAIIERQENL